MKNTLLIGAFLHLSFFINAQYVEPEKSVKEAQLKKQTEIITQPQTKFDSVIAKNMLAIGNGKITGVAFTRARSDANFGLKSGKKIYANKIKAILFPVTPYFNDYYVLWKDKTKHNPKKNRFVYMEPAAYRYRIEAISNSSGEFTFPNMKPGKYYLYGTLDYTTTFSGNEYTGSAYNGYGGRTDYYKPYEYYKNSSEFLELFVEVKSDGEEVKVKLR